MIFPPSSGISQPRLIPVLLLVNALQVGDGQSLQDFPLNPSTDCHICEGICD